MHVGSKKKLFSLLGYHKAQGWCGSVIQWYTLKGKNKSSFYGVSLFKYLSTNGIRGKIKFDDQSRIL